MIAREVLAVKEQLGLDHLDLTCLPAEFHFYPDRIAPAMDKAIEKAKAEGYTNIFVGYADCGTGGLLDRICEKHGVERMAGPHCFAFYQGMDAYAKIADDDMMSFYMTDFLCRQFDAFFMKPLGLDNARSHLRTPRHRLWRPDGRNGARRCTRLKQFLTRDGPSLDDRPP